jgi:hypothetical protein
MPFTPTERTHLLAVKGVGPTVVGRLEQMGFVSLQHLSKANALDILSQGGSRKMMRWTRVGDLAGIRA